MINSNKLKGVHGVLAAVILLAASAAGAYDLTQPTSQEETITVSNSAIGITSSKCTKSGGNGRTKAMLQVLTNAINFSVHSATNTPDTGDFYATAGQFFKLSQMEVAQLRMIRNGGSDASVKVQCYGD